MPGQEWIVSDMGSLALGRTFRSVLAWDSVFHLNTDDQSAPTPRRRLRVMPTTAGIHMFPAILIKGIDGDPAPAMT